MLVAAEFPGLFSIAQFDAMDLRDLQMWTIEAKKRRIEREAFAINSSRYAQATHEAYADRMTQLEWELKILDTQEESDV